MINVCEADPRCNYLPDSPVRRIRRRGGVHIDRQPIRRGDSGSVAISVAAVVGAAPGYVFALRRLRELPDFGKTHSALCGTWRALWKRAPRRGRAGVVRHPISDIATGGIVANIVFANILRGDDVTVIGSGHAGTIDAGAESCGGNAVNPGIDVGLLLG